MARAFNGWSQYLHTTSTLLSTEFTVACWMYWNAASGTRMCACEWDESGAGKHWYILSIGQTLYFGHSEDGTTGINKTHSATLADATWHHVCIRFKNSTSKSVSINGVHESASAPGTISSTGSPGFTIGADPGSSYTLHWAGKAADCAAWNVSLSDAEVEAMATGLRTANQVRPDALLAHWPLGGLYGDTDDDRWSGAYDLTPTNSPTWADHPRLWYPDEPEVIVPASVAPAASYPHGLLPLLGVG